jgi:DNA-binding IclR family transcriptional regulator
VNATPHHHVRLPKPGSNRDRVFRALHDGPLSSAAIAERLALPTVTVRSALDGLGTSGCVCRTAAGWRQTPAGRWAVAGGVRPPEPGTERVVAFVTAHPGASPEAIAAMLGIGRRSLYQTLTDLRRVGLLAPAGLVRATGEGRAAEPGEARVLRYLRAAGPCSPDDLADALGMARRTVKVPLAGLRRQGLVSSATGVWPAAVSP